MSNCPVELELYVFWNSMILYAEIEVVVQWRSDMRIMLSEKLSSSL